MADLELQLTSYLEKIAKDLEDLQVNPNFSDGVESLYRDANMFAILALAIGLSPEKSEIAPSVPAMIVASQNLAKVKTLEEATAAMAKLQESIGKASEANLSWGKTVVLAPVMKKAIPALSTEIKRLTRSEKTFARGNNSEKVRGASAALAVAALGCRPNVDETLAPNEHELWEKYCRQLYEASLNLNNVVHQTIEGKASFDSLSKAFDAVDETCNTTCHEKFGGATN